MPTTILVGPTRDNHNMAQARSTAAAAAAAVVIVIEGVAAAAVEALAAAPPSVEAVGDRKALDARDQARAPAMAKIIRCFAEQAQPRRGRGGKRPFSCAGVSLLLLPPPDTTRRE